MLTYPYSHATISTAMSGGAALVWNLATGEPITTPLPWLAGAAFYAAREVWQRTQLGYWDRPGILWGVGPMSVVAAILATV